MEPGNRVFIIVTLSPFVVEVEDVGGKLAVPRGHQPSRLLES